MMKLERSVLSHGLVGSMDFRHEGQVERDGGAVLV